MKYLNFFPLESSYLLKFNIHRKEISETVNISCQSYYNLMLQFWIEALSWPLPDTFAISTFFSPVIICLPDCQLKVISQWQCDQFWCVSFQVPVKLKGRLGKQTFSLIELVTLFITNLFQLQFCQYKADFAHLILHICDLPLPAPAVCRITGNVTN